MVAKGEFGVRISKKELIAPVLPVQEHWLPLSNLDLLLPPVDFSVFFCYRNHNNEGFVGVIKKALAETLVTYYALAGEVVANSSGEPELLCNNRGVHFFQAHANVHLTDLNLYNPDETVHGKLVPLNKDGVLTVQVTQLTCGGVVVGCTFDHRVADAYSANMFLVSWAEMAQSKPISTTPCFRRSLLNPRRPGCINPVLDDMYATISSLPPPNDSACLISRIYYVTLDQLNHLQSLCNFKTTKLESFSAFLWKLIAATHNKNAKMGIVVDGRTRLQSRNQVQDHLLMSSYFGNVLSIPFGSQKVNDLVSKPLPWVAEQVHNFLESAVTGDHFLGLIDWVEAHRPDPAVAKIYSNGNEEDGPAFVVSSGKRFPVSKVDFGWGKPVFGSYHFPWGGAAGYVMPMPSPAMNGDWVVYMHLMKSQLDRIEAQASHVFTPLDYAAHLINS